MAFSSSLKNPCPLGALETAMFLPFTAEVLNEPLISVCYIWANSSNMCSTFQFSLQLHPTSSVKSLLSLLFVLSGLFAQCHVFPFCSSSPSFPTWIVTSVLQGRGGLWLLSEEMLSLCSHRALGSQQTGRTFMRDGPAGTKPQDKTDKLPTPCHLSFATGPVFFWKVHPFKAQVSQGL